MALIPCPECSQQVSDSAPKCPSCGYAVAEEMNRRREKEKQKRQWKVIVIMVGFLMSTCCVTSQCQTCREDAAQEEAMKAKAEAEAKQKEEMAQLEETLRQKFAKETPAIESKLDQFEQSVANEDYETATAARSELETALQPFKPFTTKVPSDLVTIRERLKLASAWLQVKDAQKSLESGSYNEALTLLKSAEQADPGLPDLVETRRSALFKKSEGTLDQAKEKAKSKNWLEADKLLKEASSALSKIPEESRSRKEKRLSKQIDRLTSKYEKRANEKREEIAGEQAYRELCGKPPVPSSWDGGIRSVESYVKSSAHDPGSIDVENCSTPVLSSDSCWRTECHVLGKNAFGAKVRNVGTFWIASDQVVKTEM